MGIRLKKRGDWVLWWEKKGKEKDLGVCLLRKHRKDHGKKKKTKRQK